MVNKSYSFRPFLVKEEKLLLMALEGGDEGGIVNTIKQIINNCCLDDIDVDNMPVVDLEYFFLNLRARSVGEEITLEYKCNNKVEEKKCGNIVKIGINLLDIIPDIPEGHTNKIKITDDIGIVMKYPSFKMMDIMDNKSKVDATLKLIMGCIECIYDKDTIYYSKDIPVGELIEFIENLTKSQFGQIEQFFSSIPKIRINLKFHCDKCGYSEDIKLEGIKSFLA